MMSEMAAAIGEDADAAEFAALSDDVRAAFTAKLVAADGTVDGNSQTGYAMALGMDLVTGRRRTRQGGRRSSSPSSATSDNHLTTGFLGTPWLLPALSSIDRDDLAYTMLMHEDYPSWGYEVEPTAPPRCGSAGTPSSRTARFGDVGMNSFNHYAYGAVGDWMYQNIGGIKALEAGYKKSRIAPALGGGLTSGRGDVRRRSTARSPPTGRRDGDDLSLDVEVPVNTTAEVACPPPTLYVGHRGRHPAGRRRRRQRRHRRRRHRHLHRGLRAATPSPSTPQRALLGDRSSTRSEDLHATWATSPTAGDLAGRVTARRSATPSRTATDDVERRRCCRPRRRRGRVSRAPRATRSRRSATCKTWLAASADRRPGPRRPRPRRLEKIEAMFGSRDRQQSSGVSVSHAAGAPSRLLPGATVAGTIEVANAGDVATHRTSRPRSASRLGGRSGDDQAGRSSPQARPAQLPVTRRGPEAPEARDVRRQRSR